MTMQIKPLLISEKTEIDFRRSDDFIEGFLFGCNYEFFSQLTTASQEYKDYREFVDEQIKQFKPEQQMQTGFLEQFMDYTKFYESPTSFFKWSSYALVAGVLRDNLYCGLGDIKIFPNIYVLLLADSGIHRKGNPSQIGEALLKEIHNTKIISGRTSIQAILQDLAENKTDRQTGNTVVGGSAFFCAPELSASIVDDPQAIRILTDLYDYKKEFENNLIRAKSKIDNVCFTMCAASNEALLRSVYNQGAIHGGLLARTFIVKADEFRPGNSLFDFKQEPEVRAELIRSLKKLAILKGKAVLTPEAVKCYNDWYYPFRESLETRADKSGVLSRLHIGVLKLAMIIGTATNYSLAIEENHVRIAITEALSLLGNYEGFIMASGKSTMASIGARLLQSLYDLPNHTMTKKNFLQINWGDVSNEDLDKLTVTLEQAGMIKTVIGHLDTNFVATEAMLEKFREKKVSLKNGE